MSDRDRQESQALRHAKARRDGVYIPRAEMPCDSSMVLNFISCTESAIHACLADPKGTPSTGDLCAFGRRRASACNGESVEIQTAYVAALRALLIKAENDLLKASGNPHAFTPYSKLDCIESLHYEAAYIEGYRAADKDAEIADQIEPQFPTASESTNYVIAKTLAKVL